VAFHVGSSVAHRPKFLPQNAKVAPEKSQRQRKSAAQFPADLQNFLGNLAENIWPELATLVSSVVVGRERKECIA
jgi:hypothetical protein